MRHSQSRRGFSLVEILIAILLIGILMAVAVPRLLAAREAGGDSAAQTQLRTVQSAAISAFIVRGNSYGGATATTLAEDVPEVPLVSGAAALQADTQVRQVSVATSNSDTVWTAAALGGEGRCWFVRLDITQKVEYGLLTNQTSCNASTQSPAAWQEFDFPPGE